MDKKELVLLVRDYRFYKKYGLLSGSMRTLLEHFRKYDPPKVQVYGSGWGLPDLSVRRSPSKWEKFKKKLKSYFS